MVKGWRNNIELVKWRERKAAERSERKMSRFRNEFESEQRMADCEASIRRLQKPNYPLLVG